MINVLDQSTIDKIAAGEVIERPMSIVKELVENSIDAGATKITVEIKDGGTSFIRVTDNGSGIEKDDVKKAYLSHATSKLNTAEDLIGIGTLGFRGEALSTIAAVTQTEMITKTADSLVGLKYVIEGGKEIEFKEIGAPKGTTIIAKNIFYNTPVRLKFLKSNMTEGSYINDLISHIAMSHPEVSMTLISNGKTIIDTTGNDNIKETIYKLYGREIASSLLPADYSEGRIHIHGYVGKPFLARGNRGFENYFVNGRYIKSPIINRAIEEAYKTYIMQHKFPFTVLFIDIPKEECDVNIHPAKREFKYGNEKELFSAVYHAVASGLANKEMIPNAEVDYGTRDKHYKVRPDVTEEKKEIKTEIRPVERPVERQVERSVERPVEKSVERPAEKVEIPRPKKSASSYNILESLLPESFRKKLMEEETRPSYETETKPEANVTPEPEVKEEEKEDIIEETPKYEFKQETLTSSGYLEPEAFKKHTIIGQVFKTYWISEFDNSLYIMDQHAAHEKLNYETFLKEFKEREVVSQSLYPPMIINLSAAEKAAVMENEELFQKTGFDLEDFGGNDVKISAVPVNLEGLSGKEIFLEFADYLSKGVSGVTEDIFVHKIATMGCKAAIKGNQKISLMEAQQLIEKLMTLDNPYTCPHGRPTIIKITKEDLEKKFKRIVE
ncbi:MAG: DNA mismatch repair endonuclease MutL [Eubacterium sp.]|nr:DNA mismatch repair endonuclease MutL [Eubacterium sp.]